MELLVVVHGATRGTPGQGYGAYSVQSPGRKAVIKRAEFGPQLHDGPGRIRHPARWA